MSAQAKPLKRTVFHSPSNTTEIEHETNKNSTELS